MDYRHSLIHITDRLTCGGGMYSLILLDAKSLSITVGDTRCFIDGKYLLCLSEEDTVAEHGGKYTAMNLRFQPYFYNVNLNHGIIGTPIYKDMRVIYGYPDFHLFRARTERFCGILSLTDYEYNAAEYYFRRAEANIGNHGTDWMWSCKTRSEMISIMRIAESAYLGESVAEGSEAVRYIRDHIGEDLTLDSICRGLGTNRTKLTAELKELTGMTPMQFVLEERLNLSRPDLLFTHISINEIAEKYGFSDANYYIRQFKKRYGKTPGDYRSDGFAERISHENEYKLTVEKFREYYRLGMGRPIFLLRHEQDKKPYAEAYLEELAESSFGHTDGEYEAAIISCFDDPLTVRNKAVDVLSELLKKGDYTVYHTLEYLGAADVAQKIILDNYNDVYNEIKNLGNGFPEIYSTVNKYAHTCLTFISLESDFVSRVITDFADLFDNVATDAPWVKLYLELMAGIETGGAPYREIAEKVLGDTEHRNKDIVLSLIPAPRKNPEPLEGMGTDYFTHFDDRKAISVQQYVSFPYASPEVNREVAEFAVNETDLTKKANLLRYFEDIFCAEAPMFPLSSELLIEIIEKHRSDLDDFVPGESEPPPSYVLMQNAVEVLARMNDDIAKAYCLAMPHGNDKTAKFIGATALRTLLYNYDSDDAGILQSLIAKEHLYGAILTLELFEKDVPDVPEEFLYPIYEYIPFEYRIRVVNEMIKRGMLTVELRRECLCDANPKIRAAVANCKKQKVITRTEGII